MAWSIERYGLAIPKYTVPSGPTAGVFHAPPVPFAPPADRSAGFFVSWNFHRILPFFSARFAVRQSCFPVAAERANAYAGISPYRVPFTRATPFGPSPIGSELSDAPLRPEECVHSVFPVLPSTANTL